LLNILVSKSETMDVKKRIAILGLLISMFVFSVSFATIYAQIHIIEGTACYCTIPIPILIPTFASLGLVIGLTTYLIVTRNPEVKTMKKEDFLKLFDQEERAVIEEILENGGSVTQSKISRKIGKVKAFRILENLRRKGVIEKEKYGKTNRVMLKKEYLDVVQH